MLHSSVEVVVMVAIVANELAIVDNFEGVTVAVVPSEAIVTNRLEV